MSDQPTTDTNTSGATAAPASETAEAKQRVRNALRKVRDGARVVLVHTVDEPIEAVKNAKDRAAEAHRQRLAEERAREAARAAEAATATEAELREAARIAREEADALEAKADQAAQVAQPTTENVEVTTS